MRTACSLACLLLLPSVVAAQGRGRRPEPSRRPALQVPAPTLSWDVILQPLLQLPLEPGHDARILNVDAAATSAATTSRVEVAGSVLGYFIRDCTPQLAVFAHEYSPLHPGTVRCHVMVVSPSLQDQSISWGNVEGIFTDVAWACGVPVHAGPGSYGRHEIEMVGCVDDGGSTRTLRSATMRFDDTVTVKELGSLAADADLAGACQASGNGLVLVRDRRHEIAEARTGALVGARLRRWLEGMLADAPCTLGTRELVDRITLSSLDEECVRQVATALEVKDVSFVRPPPLSVLDESGHETELHALIVPVQ